VGTNFKVALPKIVADFYGLHGFLQELTEGLSCGLVASLRVKFWFDN